VPPIVDHFASTPFELFGSCLDQRTPGAAGHTGLVSGAGASSPGQSAKPPRVSGLHEVR